MSKRLALTGIISLDVPWGNGSRPGTENQRVVSNFNRVPYIHLHAYILGKYMNSTLFHAAIGLLVGFYKYKAVN